jgi:hypothetical protein
MRGFDDITRNNPPDLGIFTTLVDATLLRQAHDLADDDTSTLLGRHGLGKGFESRDLLLHADVAEFIGRRAANQAGIKVEMFVPEIFFPVEGHDFNEIFFERRSLPPSGSGSPTW